MAWSGILMTLFLLKLCVFSSVINGVQGFVNPPSRSCCHSLAAKSYSSEESMSSDGVTQYSRRAVWIKTMEGVTVVGGAFLTEKASAEEGYRPAQRPTAYRVDSTQPPTLIPLSNARKEEKVLTELGKGLGTQKSVIVDDRVNLNNVLNKAVFGTIDAASELVGSKQSQQVSGPGFASFVCMGVPSAISSHDVDLVESLVVQILKGRREESALALSFCPFSLQVALDKYLKDGNEEDLLQAFEGAGISGTIVETYMPLIRFSRKKSLKLLAISPEKEDVMIARTKGLQNVDLERRKLYVSDGEGFVATSADPRFRMYTERSLLKDFTPISNDDKPGDFFAERILVHEAAATAVARFAVERPDSLVFVIAPTPDLRFLLGINGRIPRVCKFLDNNSRVTGDFVTTILLNPTASETLSKSRYLRLEIGTGPDTLDFQTKVSDYLWFSFSPKVNTIPRLMNG